MRVDLATCIRDWFVSSSHPKAVDFFLLLANLGLHTETCMFYVLGKAICKSLEVDIAECMGVSLTEVVSGLVRLLFVRCVAVQLDGAHSLCQILGKVIFNSVR